MTPELEEKRVTECSIWEQLHSAVTNVMVWLDLLHGQHGSHHTHDSLTQGLWSRHCNQNVKIRHHATGELGLPSNICNICMRIQEPILENAWTSWIATYA
eukprot:1799998-Amphidinium_carterae.1